MNALCIALFVLSAQALPQPAASVQGVIAGIGDAGPVENARVELIRVDGTSPQTYAEVSAGDGSFLIQNVRPGVYRLAASRPGFLRREFGQRSRAGNGIAVNLEPGQVLRNLDIEMRPSAAISGRVTDVQGDPVGGAEIRALVSAYPDGQRVLRAVQATQSNDLGEYRLFGLAAGEYYVSATPVAQVDIFEREFIVYQVMTSQAFPTLGGSPGTAVYFPNTTDSRLSRPIDVGNGGEFGGVNITMVSSKTYHVRGTVLGGMAHVKLVPLDPGKASNVRESSASEGPFDIAGVTPGDYLLVGKSGDLLGIVPINVGESDLDRIVVSLSPAGSLPTHVGFDDASATDNDPDLENINLNLVADPPIPGTPPDLYAPFANGRLAFQVLVRQNYRATNLVVRGSPTPSRLRNAYIKSIRMGDRDAMNEGFSIDDPEKISTLEIVIGTKPGRLTGTVTNDKQKPQINATVLLVPDAGRRRWSDAYRTTSTDLSGRYAIDRIAPGDYFVYSWEEIEDGAWMAPDFLKKVEDRSRRVHISEGETQTVNVSAIP